MSIRRRKRRRSDPSMDIVSSLSGFGFTHEQIANVLGEVENVNDSDEQFQRALDILLADNANESISNNKNNVNNNVNDVDRIEEPPKKRRRVHIESNDNEQESKPKLNKTEIELKEESLNEKEHKLIEGEKNYKQWEKEQTKFENKVESIRDHINDLYSDVPKLPQTDASTMKMEDLLTERIQLRTIIDSSSNAMLQHLNFCNDRLNEVAMIKLSKKQQIENDRFEFEQEKNEFESQKYALQIMQNEAKSGDKLMSLIEHNLFIVASAINGAPKNEYFQKINAKIRALQNQNHSNSNSKQEKDEISFECGICFTNYDNIENILIFDECLHFYCMQCLKATFKVKLEDRNVKNIKCPHDKCDHLLNTKEIKYILTKEEFAKYDDYLLDKTLQSAKDAVFCPGVDCGAAMFGYSDSPMLTCPKCAKQFCFNCGTEEWHQGVTCEAFKQWKIDNGKADVKFAEWAKAQKAKKCPQCQSMIEKNGGCDHMTCRNCGYEFHWQTLEKWKGYQHQYNVAPAQRGRGRGGNRNRRRLFRDDDALNVFAGFDAEMALERLRMNNRNRNHRNAANPLFASHDFNRMMQDGNMRMQQILFDLQQRYNV